MLKNYETFALSYSKIIKTYLKGYDNLEQRLHIIYNIPQSKKTFHFPLAA